MDFLVAAEADNGPAKQAHRAALPPRRGFIERGLNQIGGWLRRRQGLIQRVQWSIVIVYLVLVATPAFLPLPGRMAHIWDNLTLFAQFAFWGIWWPFVLLSMVLVGRAWCGLFCPEGALSEATSRFGKGYAVPRWITWKGWPFVAFVCTTVYGQMVSVYQYPKPALLILGGSTLGAIAVGYLYGRNKRVWCRYLCPVNGVFGLLAKLAPVHFSVDQDAWTASRLSGHAHAAPINCAPLVPIRTMRGGADCHMCGRCEGFRGAIELAPRAPNHEIVHVAGSAPKPWETLLIVFGLMGVAAGAFHWSASPWYVSIKQALAGWLIEQGLVWPLQVQPPWWILTDYPDLNDQLTLLDGAVLLFYIGATAAIIGGLVSLCLWLATRSLGPWSSAAFHHFAQSLIPIAACGVFLGLSAMTVTFLRAEGASLGFVGLLRGGLLAGAALWSIGLSWRIAGLRTRHAPRRFLATAWIALAASIGVGSWVLLFWVW
ncbi:4Fe-4S binding protein [Methylocapsa aurea]|uniref:4Fe-4S binding protein n=1 Tax=Methylocapsa aurea TaxID=663610 RepID=UPI0009FC7ED7|nr:4Fe-4S binding protein [Methylocapsa aurea]